MSNLPKLNATTSGADALETLNPLVKGRTGVKQVKPDGLQSNEIGVGVTTHPSGFAWMRLPHLEGAQYIRNQIAGGVNVPYQFRRRMRVNMPGLRPKGDWTPDAAANGVQSLNKIGVLSNTTDYGYRKYDTSGLPSKTGLNNGDYLVAMPIGGGTITSGSGVGTLYPGDLAVLWNNAWVVQKAPPGNSSTMAEKDFWNVSAAGVFDGVTYSIGDRIIGSGGQYYREFRRGRPDLGEMFLQGEFDASTGFVAGTGAAPVNPTKGDAWQVSVAGTFSGIVLALNDWLLHDGSGYYGVPTNTITTTVASKPFLIDIVGDLSDWEVRRADKGTSTYPVKLWAPGQQTINVAPAGAYFFGDSMAHNIYSSMMTAFTGEIIDVQGYDSDGSESMASIFEGQVLKDSSRWAGRTLFPWFGHNTENDWQQTSDAILRVRRAASPDSIVIPIAPAGRREFTYDSGLNRLVGKWQEPMKTGTDLTNGMVMTVLAIAKMTQGRYINSRQVVIDMVAANPAAFSGPDKQAPGMTEAQTAATYGWIPLSCYRTNAVIAAATNFLGYWSNASALPTGGSAGDYYLRSATGTGTQYAGNIIANVAGTWTEDPTGDRGGVVHFATPGPNKGLANDAISAATKARYDNPLLVAAPIPGF
jgi:hypothetical protein